MEMASVKCRAKRLLLFICFSVATWWARGGCQGSPLPDGWRVLLCRGAHESGIPLGEEESYQWGQERAWARRALPLYVAPGLFHHATGCLCGDTYDGPALLRLDLTNSGVPFDKAHLSPDAPHLPKPASLEIMTVFWSAICLISQLVQNAGEKEGCSSLGPS